MENNHEKSGREPPSDLLKSLDHTRITALVQSVSMQNLPATLVAKQVIITALSVSPSTLKHYRKLYWIEGIHYFYLSPKVIRFNLELVKHWAMTRADPQAHHRAIEAFLFELESTQSAGKRRRKPK